MRIRKNAKLGSVPLEKLQTHVVCQLNQSPWDVIPFGSDPTQFDEGEDSFTGNANGSPGDSVGAVESVASMMDADEKSLPKIADMVVDDNNDIDDKDKTTSCHQCKNNEANKQSQSFCEHNNLSATRSKKVTVAPAASGVRRSRPRAAKKAPAATSNPYEFYYYSGFGPLWGKRRGDRNGGLSNRNEAKVKGGENSTITEANGATIHSSTSPCSSSRIDNEAFDYAEDDDEEDDDEEKEEEEDEDEDDDDYVDEVEEGNGESGKKRMRKPVKARSLKSLM